MRLRNSLVLAVATVAAFALAASACTRGPTTQREMRESGAGSLAAADADLNSLYKDLAAKLGEDDRSRLRSAERAWVAYRNANCSAETALYEGGSIAATVSLACSEHLTRERIAELRRIYEEQLRP